MTPSARRSLVPALLGMFSILALVSTAAAADRVGISPVLIEKTMKPGDTYNGTITVTNLGDGDVTVHPSTADFYYDANGNMQFLEGDAEPIMKSASLKSWLRMDAPDTFVIKKDDQIEIPIHITVPADAEPGGHYGVLFAQTVPNATDAAVVRVSGRVGALVLIEVPGAVRKTADLLRFGVGATPTEGSTAEFRNATFFEHGPVDFSFVLRNTGNSHFIPEGRIVVKNWFGREVANLELGQSDSTRRIRAFPGIERTFLTRWSPGLAFGRYTAEVEVKDGTGKPLPKMSMAFTIFPWKTVLGSIAVLLIAGTLLVVLIKRYNAYIINQARRK